MKCKNQNCNKSFHACSSCSLGHDWEYSFCSEKCYLEHHRELIDQICYFKVGLTYSQLQFLQYCINEVDEELFSSIINQE